MEETAKREVTASPSSVQVEEVKNCILCDRHGVLLHAHLHDRVFGVPGEWNLLKCPECGLVWLDPQPLAAEVGKLYGTYYTHKAEDTSLRTRLRDAVLLTAVGASDRLRMFPWRMLGAILYAIPSIRNAARTASLHLGGMARGSLLDVGCGGGRLLRLMRDRGWEVEGVEPDPTSAELTRQSSKVPVHVSPVEKLDVGERRFDVVTMNHVLEHLKDPFTGLRACWRVLKPGGRIAVLIPNVESLGHRFFGEHCFLLEPPRHLYLYSPKTLKRIVEGAGFEVELLETSTRSASSSWVSSNRIRRTGRCKEASPTVWEIVVGGLFSLLENGLHMFSPDVGEEVILMGKKR